ncbi:MAG: MFS transporter [Deltaproteobacteria bacterium]|nr:MFS transporter [Deltaproteobacteria bacterium]
MSPRDPESNPLRVPAFRRLLVGRVLGVLGRQILSVSVGWQVYDRTRSAWALGLIGLIQVLPVVALVVPAGMAADRYDRRRIAVITQVVLALLGLAMVEVTRSGAPIGWMFPVLLGCGCVTAFSAPAISSITPNLVPPAAFVQANAWNATTFELSAIAGPAVAGALLAWSGPALAYGCVTAFALAFAVTLVGLPEIRAGEEAGGGGAGRGPRATAARRSAPASSSCGARGSCCRRSPSTSSPCCSAASPRSCRSSPATCCRWAPPGSAGCAPRPPRAPSPWRS